MKFLSLFSGIEACSVAWKPLGWECERLMGFPDGYTDVPNNGKPASNSARYKALGNSMAVPVMRYIAEQLENAVNYNRIER